MRRGGRGAFAPVRKLLENQDLLLLGLVALLVLVVIARVPDFWHIETLFNIARSSMVSVVFALGAMIILLAGGIDVSFLAVGIFAAYLTCKLVPQDGPIEAAFLPIMLSIAIGVALGLFNAVVVLGARVSVLIATLATSAIFLGVLFAFIGGVVINRIPEPLARLGQTSLAVLPGAQRGETRLNIMIVAVIAVCLLLWAFLKWALPGRWIYSIGGDAEAARRNGIPV
jgi:simple sugar transport system permease protein